MAFCTNCGASVAGAFCVQCGTPVRAGTGPAAASPAPAAPSQPYQAPGQPYPQAVPVPSAAAPKKISPLVWVLIILAGCFVLGMIGLVGGGLFVANRIAHHPASTVARIIAAANPDAEVVGTDENAGTITMRDRKTGETVTMNLEDAKNGRIRFSARDDHGKTATMDIGGSAAGKLPSWVPQYPGASSQPTFSVRGESNDESGEGGNVTFTTNDAPSKVLSYYQDKAKELGMKVNLTNTGDQGGMIVASDDDSKRTLTVVVGGGSSGTAINVTYAAKR
jgi:hypothetical protein